MSQPCAHAVDCPMEQKIDAILKKLEEIESGFPDGPFAHRMSHESMIRAAQAEERFWTEMKLDIAKKGVWGLLIVLIGLVMVGISVKLGIGAPR